MTSDWDRLAHYRDARMGERGDLWHRALIDPAVRRAVGRVRGVHLLEVACGNGYLTRRFAAEGATAPVGIDRSEASIRIARVRERRRPRGVSFAVADAARLPFGTGRFDLVVANMALMDVRDARRAVREASRVLRPGGRFVFSLAHPCFDLDNHSVWSIERGFGPDGVYRDTVYRKVQHYREERMTRVPWNVGPGTVLWTESYHRTLATYVRYLRLAGLWIRRLEEPTPGPEMIRGSPQGPYIREIPLHLVVEAVKLPPARAGSRTPVRSRPEDAQRSGSRARIRGTGSPRPGSKSG